MRWNVEVETEGIDRDHDRIDVPRHLLRTAIESRPELLDAQRPPEPDGITLQAVALRREGVPERLGRAIRGILDLCFKVFLNELCLITYFTIPRTR